MGYPSLTRCRLAGFMFALGCWTICFPACGQPVDTSSFGGFVVRVLARDVKIDIFDRSLRDWPASSQVWTLVASPSGETSQLQSIRGQVPAPLSSDDLTLRVLMAHDTQHWFIGLHVIDDHFVSTMQSDHPYGGDSFEIFFAGEELASIADISDIIAERRPSDSPAFFQLLLHPGSATSSSSMFSPYRSDRSLIQLATTENSSLGMTTWGTSAREWASELRIPVASLSGRVQGDIREGLPLRVAFDYLDYDGQPAPNHDIAPFYGFRPDNVFAPTTVERSLHTPSLMPTLTFERPTP